jgi:hypothetical protein
MVESDLNKKLLKTLDTGFNMTHYIHENKGGSYRDSTTAEIDAAFVVQAERIRLQSLIDTSTKQLKALTKDCVHDVCFDTAGFPYDVRNCVACGNLSLL